MTYASYPLRVLTAAAAALTLGACASPVDGNDPMSMYVREAAAIHGYELEPTIEGALEDAGRESCDSLEVGVGRGMTLEAAIDSLASALADIRGGYDVERADLELAVKYVCPGLAS